MYMMKTRSDSKRQCEKTREMITVTLGGKLDGFTPVKVDIPVMRPMPDVLLWHDRIYIRRSDDRYSVAKAWPLIDELDKVPKRMKRKIVASAA